MDLEVEVFYPFHPLCGRTLPAVCRGKETVTVIAADERRLKIPIWMTRPDAGGYVITDKPTIDLRALLSLSRLLHSGQPEPHGTLSEPGTTPAAGGEDETVGACAVGKELASKRDTDGPGDAGEVGSVDGDNDHGGSTSKQEV
jgi:hypothetical protein